MKQKYLKSSMKTLREQYQLDPINDILLARSDKIIGYVDIHDLENPLFHVISGNLNRIHLEDKENIPLKTFVDILDLDNGYALVSGSDEYRSLIQETILDFSTHTDLTFPIIANDHRHWIHVVIISLPKHPDVFALHITDVTDGVNSEEQLFIKSHLDSLTGLFNKYTLDYHYGLRYHFENFHALYLDLDNFKELNDSVGHRVANKYLKAFADILKSKQYELNQFYRIGGDEFVGLIYLPSEKVIKMAEEILSETRKLETIGGSPISVSIGIVASTISEDVIGKADKCMYKAKNSGKDKYVFELEKS